MWLFTDRGFYSAVVHRDDASLLIVRSRVRKDLVNLEEILPGIKSRIFEDKRADYRYRVIVSKIEWARICGHLVGRMDYDNFKDAVKDKQGKQRASAYMAVWSAMLRLQPIPRWKTSRQAGQRSFGTSMFREPRRLFEDDASESVDTTRAWWEEPHLTGFEPVEGTLEKPPAPTGGPDEDDYLLREPTEEDLRWADAFRAQRRDTQAGT